MVLILFVFIFGIYLDGRKIANIICDLFGWRAKRKYVFAIYLACAKNANNIRTCSHIYWMEKKRQIIFVPITIQQGYYKTTLLQHVYYKSVCGTHAFVYKFASYHEHECDRIVARVSSKVRAAAFV